MGRPPSDRELKRMGRVLAGHSRDKDRERWKRKLRGQAALKMSPRKGGAADETLDDPLEPEPPDEQSQ